MSKRKYSPNAKHRILDAAKSIFAEKGFDGARVDEIAKAANVPKSLIYYHFNSKDSILEELLQNSLDQFQQILVNIDTGPLASQPFSEHLRAMYFQYIEENVDVFRIIGMEALKKHGGKTPLAFRAVELLMKHEEERLKPSQPLGDEARSARMVREFFFGHLPLVLFACFRDEWSHHFNVSLGTLSQQFLETYQQTYVATRPQN
jgi:AcrR family transcriptional regulator